MHMHRYATQSWNSRKVNKINSNVNSNWKLFKYEFFILGLFDCFFALLYVMFLIFFMVSPIWNISKLSIGNRIIVVMEQVLN